jgi:hypothetical protein
VISWFSRGAVIALLFGATGVGCPAAANEPGQALTCTSAEERFGFAKLVCRVEPSEVAQHLRITATFAGVHDDSFAALATSEGGQPVACGTGARIRIQGEDNGDTLVCPFGLPAASAAREVTVTLVWHHAEPASFALLRD